MTGEHILEVLAIYEEGTKEIEPLRADPHVRFPSQGTALRHARYMMGEIRSFVGEQKLDKAQRWLGFLQAILWTHGIYSIEDMKNHNRGKHGEEKEGGSS